MGFAFSSPPQFNTTYWTTSGRVKSGKSAYDAIADMWNSPAKYKMACLRGAAFVMERGISQAMGSSEFDRIAGNNPFGNIWSFLKRRHTVNNADWIPGDWGYIDNPTPGAPGLTTGENVIYLGGSFAEDFSTFKDNAKFWGHIPGTNIYTLSEWMEKVRNWSSNTLHRADIDTYRDYPMME